MSPVTHFLTGWVLGSVVGSNRRERAIVTFAVVVPDVDGLGIIPELLTRQSRHPVLWFSQYHHDLHTLLFAVVVFLCAFFLTGRRWKPADHNHDLKGLFKGVATMASARPGPFQDFYQALLAKGLKPTMARLTLARKIAAITLTLWKKGASFDAEKLKPQAA